MSQKDLPKLTKDISEFAPTKKDISARIRSAGAKTIIAALGFLGINVGTPTAFSSPAAEIAPAPVIVNRKERTGPGLVLQLASNLADRMSFLGHSSHSSHASHASHSSHYSSSGGSVTPVSPKPPTTVLPAEAEDSSLLTVAQTTITGKVTEIQAEKKCLVLKDASEMIHTIYFEGTTRIRLLSPSDQMSTIDALKAFTGSVPVKVGNNIMVQLKTVDGKKTAVQITLFELSR